MVDILVVASMVSVNLLAEGRCVLDDSKKATNWMQGTRHNCRTCGYRNGKLKQLRVHGRGDPYPVYRIGLVDKMV